MSNKIIINEEQPKNLDETSELLIELGKLNGDKFDFNEGVEEKEYQSEEEDNNDLEEIIEDFIDTKDFNDILNSKGKFINSNYNYYTNESGMLNNPNTIHKSKFKYRKAKIEKSKQ